MKTSKNNIIYNTVSLMFCFGFFLIIPIIKAEDIPIYKNSNVYIYMQSIYKDGKAHSFWTKTNYSNGYTLSEINLDCKNHSYSTKSYKFYDLNNKLVDFKQNNLYSLYRTSIVPNSVEDKYYKIVCNPINKYSYKAKSFYNKERKHQG